MNCNFSVTLIKSLDQSSIKPCLSLQPLEKYIETRRHVSIQITYMWRVRWKYRGDINTKFKAKSLQYYTGYQKGIKSDQMKIMLFVYR